MTAPAGPNGSIAAERRGDGELRHRPHLLHRRQPLLPHRRRAGGWRARSGRWAAHLRRRRRQPHHLRQLRDRRRNHHRVSADRTARSRSRARSASTAARTRRSPSPPAPATTSPTCWWTARRSGRWAATPSPTSPPTTRITRQLRDRQPHADRLAPGLNGSIAPSGAATVDCGTDQHLLDRRGLLLPHRRRAGGRRRRSGRGQLHLRRRRRQPHHRRKLRDRHLRHQRRRRDANGCDLALGAWSASTAAADQTFTITASPCYHIADVVPSTASSVRSGGQLHLHQRDREPQHQRQLRDRHLRRPSPPAAGPNGSISPGGGRRRRARTDQTYSITARSLLPHRRRAGGRELGRSGGQLHLHRRDRQPHHQRQLRDQQLTR